MKRNDILKSLNAGIFFCVILITFFISNAIAGISVMNDKDLADVDGQFSSIKLVSFYNTNDTVRIFLDLHMELYGTIDSLKAGYYFRPTSDLVTNMASAGLSGFEGFYDVSAMNGGANFNFAKITSNFNTMAPQGDATYQPWGNGMYTGGSSAASSSDNGTPNINHNDWDLWIDNIRFGESPDKPVYMNGMIMRLEFDGDVTTGNRHLKRIIIGNNDTQGNIRANYQRFTGIANPMLLTVSAGRSLGVGDAYKYTTGTMQFIRDSYLQCFGINIFNVEDRDTGNWFIMNFKGDHIGYEIIAGLPENAIDFSYTDGLKRIPLWDPDWRPTDPTDSNGNYINPNGSPADPYNTANQFNSHKHGPTTK